MKGRRGRRVLSGASVHHPCAGAPCLLHSISRRTLKEFSVAIFFHFGVNPKLKTSRPCHKWISWKSTEFFKSVFFEGQIIDIMIKRIAWRTNEHSGKAASKHTNALSSSLAFSITSKAVCKSRTADQNKRKKKKGRQNNTFVSFNMLPGAQGRCKELALQEKRQLWSRDGISY